MWIHFFMQSFFVLVDILLLSFIKKNGFIITVSDFIIEINYFIIQKNKLGF